MHETEPPKMIQLKPALNTTSINFSVLWIKCVENGARLYVNYQPTFHRDVPSTRRAMHLIDSFIVWVLNFSINMNNFIPLAYRLFSLRFMFVSNIWRCLTDNVCVFTTCWCNGSNVNPFIITVNYLSYQSLAKNFNLRISETLRAAIKTQIKQESEDIVEDGPLRQHKNWN